MLTTTTLLAKIGSNIFFGNSVETSSKIDNEIQREKKSFFKETNLKLDRGNPR